MATNYQHFHTTTGGTKPTTTGLLVGEIGLDVINGFVFLGDGTNVYTQADGTPGAAPPAGRGFKEFQLSGGGNVFTAATITPAGITPTTAELTTAFGNPANLQPNDTGIIQGGAHQGIYKYDGTNWIKSTSTLQVYTAASVTKATATASPTSAELSTAFGSTGLEQENDIGVVTAGEDSGTYVYTGALWQRAEPGVQVVNDTTGLADTAQATITTAFGNTPQKGDQLISTAGANQGIYLFDGTNWIRDPNANLRVTNVTAVADVATANTAATGADEGDVLIIADSTGLGAQTTFGGAARDAAPTGFTEGTQSIAYILNSGGTWSVLSTPLDIVYTAGTGLTQATAASTITFAADFGVAAELADANNTVGTQNKIARSDHNHGIGSLQNTDVAAVSTVTAANQTGLLVRDASVANEFDAAAWKMVNIITAGTF